MAQVTSEMIKEIRKRTGVGMTDCKKALVEANCDIEEAIKILRKKGVAVAAKRSGNATDQGMVCAKSSENRAALLYLACETDFAARTEAMKDFANKALDCALQDDSDSSSADSLLTSILSQTGMKLQESLDELISKVSESIKIASISVFDVDGCAVVDQYVHSDKSMGSIIHIQSDKELSDENKDKVKTLARMLCMQATICNPIAVTSDQIDSKILDDEKQAYKSQLATTNKPEAMWDKIVEGKLKKFYKDVCLVEQEYIRDDKKSVQQVLAELSKEVGAELQIVKFARASIS